MSEDDAPGGRGRFFGRRRRKDDPEGTGKLGDPAGEPGFEEWLAEPRSIEAEFRPADERASELDPEAQARREAEAAAIQLARERAIAESLSQLERERFAADQDARDTALAKLTLWTDTHCHIQYAPDDAEAESLVQRAPRRGPGG